MVFFNTYNRPAYRPVSLFDELDVIRKRMDQLFGAYPGVLGRVGQSSVFPAINLTENNEKFFIRAELPGISQEDLDIQATGNGLFIAGERKIPAQEGVKYHRREREAGKFSRAVNLPSEIDTERIHAELRQGILTIAIPKAEKAKPRQIEVK